jgi:hypothetical protein
MAKSKKPKAGTTATAKAATGALVGEQQLAELLRRLAISREDKVLLVLASGAGGGAATKTIKQIRTEGVAAGFRDLNYWNVSDVLSRTAGHASRRAEGYRLTAAGKARVKRVVTEAAAAPPAQPARPRYV